MPDRIEPGGAGEVISALNRPPPVPQGLPKSGQTKPVRQVLRLQPPVTRGSAGREPQVGCFLTDCLLRSLLVQVGIWASGKRMKVKSNPESAAGGRHRTVISTKLVTGLFPLFPPFFFFLHYAPSPQSPFPFTKLSSALTRTGVTLPHNLSPGEQVALSRRKSCSLKIVVSTKQSTLQ